MKESFETDRQVDGDLKVTQDPRDVTNDKPVIYEDKEVDQQVSDLGQNIFLF